jgi:hypothetical protein
MRASGRRWIRKMIIKNELERMMRRCWSRKVRNQGQS